MSNYRENAMRRDKPDPNVRGTTVLDDERFDAVTEKVIAFMARTEPEEWSKEIWTFYLTTWKELKSRSSSKKDESKANRKQMNSEEVSAYLRGDPLTPQS